MDVWSSQTYHSEDLTFTIDVTPSRAFSVTPTAVQQQIRNELAEIDSLLAGNKHRIDRLDQEVVSLTNDADGLDYVIAVGSGVLTGLFDALFVDEFSLEYANEWGNKTVEDFVIRVAKSSGYSGSS